MSTQTDQSPQPKTSPFNIVKEMEETIQGYQITIGYLNYMSHHCEVTPVPPPSETPELLSLRGEEKFPTDSIKTHDLEKGFYEMCLRDWEGAGLNVPTLPAERWGCDGPLELFCRKTFPKVRELLDQMDEQGIVIRAESSRLLGLLADLEAKWRGQSTA